MPVGHADQIPQLWHIRPESRHSNVGAEKAWLAQMTSPARKPSRLLIYSGFTSLEQGGFAMGMSVMRALANHLDGEIVDGQLSCMQV